MLLVTLNPSIILLSNDSFRRVYVELFKAVSLIIVLSVFLINISIYIFNYTIVLYVTINHRIYIFIYYRF